MITLNKVVIKPTIFPDKTSQIWKLDPNLLDRCNVYEIEWEFEYEGELMHLAQLKDLLDSYGKDSYLYLPYLPYGRQDKMVSNETTFALKTFAKLVYLMDFRRVTIFDPHSDEIRDELKSFDFLGKNPGVKFIYPIAEVNKAFTDSGSNIICYPDLGALIKYGNLFKQQYMQFRKSRDSLTGNIITINMMDSDEPVESMKDKNVLIVDDICDGGATFILAAKELFKLQANKVSLYVSHGLFTKGLSVLTDAGISSIYTKEGKIL